MPGPRDVAFALGAVVERRRERSDPLPPELLGRAQIDQRATVVVESGEDLVTARLWHR